MKRSCLIIFQVLISTGILYYLLTLVPTSRIIEVATSAKSEFILLAVLVSAINKYAEACRMKMITDCQSLGVTTNRIFQINLASAFYELFLPSFVTGGAVRWYKLSQSNGRRAEAMAAIGLNRLIHLVLLMLVGGTFWIFSAQNQGNSIHPLMLIVPLGLVTLLGIILMGHQVFDVSVSILGKNRLPYVPNVIQEKLGKVTRAFGHFQTLTRSIKLKIIGLGFFQVWNGILTFYLFTLALELPLSLLTIVWIHTSVTLLTMLPISIAGLGVREGTLTVTLAPYGIALGEVMALSLFMFMMSFIWGALGGLIEGWNLFWPIRKSSIPKVNPTQSSVQ